MVPFPFAGFFLRLVTVLAFGAGLALSGTVTSPALHLDAAWRNYANKQQGYCLSYPSRWTRTIVEEGGSLSIHSGARRFALPSGAIDVGALRKEVPPTGEFVELHLDDLRKFQRAQKVEVLESRPVSLFDTEGLLTKSRYFDPQEKQTWADVLVVASHGTARFRLELECRADQLTRFEPVFQRVLNSFRADCASHR